MNNQQNEIFSKHFNELTERYPALSSIKGDLEKAFSMTAKSISNQNKILCAGNGGSSSDAEHIVGELLKGFLKRRPVENSVLEAIKTHFPEEANDFANNLQMPLPAVSLMGHNAFQTAFANDMEPVYSIAQHLLGLGKKGDTAIFISTSGNSKNIVLAAKLAKSLGINSIGLTGEKGGELARICDACIKAPSGKVHHVQEYHLPIYHSLCLMLEDLFFRE